MQTLLLPHEYGLNEQTEVAAYGDMLTGDASFGGASVTIPHKVIDWRLPSIDKRLWAIGYLYVTD